MLKKKKSGFTLIEMIIVISLTLIVIGVTSSIFITGNRVFSDSDIKTTLQMEGKNIQEKISDIVMQAKSIVKVSETEMIINSYDKNGNEEKVNIKKDGNKLILTTNDIDEQILSDNIENFNLAYKPQESNPSLIVIDLELIKKNIKYPISFSVTFRNKL